MSVEEIEAEDIIVRRIARSLDRFIAATSFHSQAPQTVPPQFHHESDTNTAIVKKLSPQPEVVTPPQSAPPPPPKQSKSPPPPPPAPLANPNPPVSRPPENPPHSTPPIRGQDRSKHTDPGSLVDNLWKESEIEKFNQRKERSALTTFIFGITLVALILILWYWYTGGNFNFLHHLRF